MRRRVNPGSLGGHAESWFENRGLNVTQKLSKKQNEDLQICFEIFDADGSGSVEKDEVQEAMDMLGIPFSEKDIDELFLELDADGDESLTVEEFKVLIMTQIHNNGPKGGNKAKGPNIDLKLFSQALQRRQHLENVINLDSGALADLVELQEHGIKQITKSSRTQGQRFGVNDVPIPLRYTPRSRHHHHISMTAFTSGVSTATQHIEGARKMTMSRTLKGLDKSSLRRKNEMGRSSASEPPSSANASQQSFGGFEPYRGVWSPQRGSRKNTQSLERLPEE